VLGFEGHSFRQGGRPAGGDAGTRAPQCPSPERPPVATRTSVTWGRYDRRILHRRGRAAAKSSPGRAAAPGVFSEPAAAPPIPPVSRRGRRSGLGLSASCLPERRAVSNGPGYVDRTTSGSISRWAAAPTATGAARRRRPQDAPASQSPTP
jgi:hypothetical protein